MSGRPMGNVDEAERLTNLLRETVNLICKSSLHFKSQLSVVGTIGITLDKKQMLLVSLEELIHQQGALKTRSDYKRKADRSINRAESSRRQEDSSTGASSDGSLEPEESRERNRRRRKKGRHSRPRSDDEGDARDRNGDVTGGFGDNDIGNRQSRDLSPAHAITSVTSLHDPAFTTFGDVTKPSVPGEGCPTPANPWILNPDDPLVPPGVDPSCIIESSTCVLKEEPHSPGKSPRSVEIIPSPHLLLPPPSATHEQTPPSTSHKQTPPSASHKQTPPSATHEQTPPSTSHKQTPPSTTHEQTPPSATHEQTPPSAEHQPLPFTSSHVTHDTPMGRPPTESDHYQPEDDDDDLVPDAALDLDSLPAPENRERAADVSADAPPNVPYVDKASVATQATFTCVTCTKTFKHRKSVKIHRQNQHACEAYARRITDRRRRPSENPCDSGKKGRYRCDKCLGTYCFYSGLQNHKKNTNNCLRQQAKNVEFEHRADPRRRTRKSTGTQTQGRTQTD